MIIEIAGHGNISTRLAHDLIADFVKAQDKFCVFWIPEAEKRRTPIMHALPDIFDSMQDSLEVFEVEPGDQADILFILDQDSDADLVGEYRDAGKPVYDLCLALYPVVAYDASVRPVEPR